MYRHFGENIYLAVATFRRPSSQHLKKFLTRSGKLRSNQTDDIIDIYNTNSESSNIGLYGLIGKVPKYSKPFSQAYLQKVQNDYKNWINSCQEKEYHEMMKEAELQDSKLKSDYSNALPIQDQNSSTKFDPCKARHILSKSLRVKYTNFNENQTNDNKTTLEKRNSLNYDKIARLHQNKQFHVGLVERRNDGTFKTFDQAVMDRREAQEQTMSKKILRYDELDLEQKKQKARSLHAEMTNFLNTKRNEKLQLGLACHQEWALIKASAPSLNNQFEIQRPITASSKEAMDELEEFEQKQKLLRKEKKAALAQKEEPKQNTKNLDNNQNENDQNPDQSFRLTQLPPGSAIVG